MISTCSHFQCAGITEWATWGWSNIKTLASAHTAGLCWYLLYSWKEVGILAGMETCQFNLSQNESCMPLGDWSQHCESWIRAALVSVFLLSLICTHSSCFHVIVRYFEETELSFTCETTAVNHCWTKGFLIKMNSFKPNWMWFCFSGAFYSETRFCGSCWCVSDRPGGCNILSMWIQGKWQKKGTNDMRLLWYRLLAGLEASRLTLNAVWGRCAPLLWSDHRSQAREFACDWDSA